MLMLPTVDCFAFLLL